MANTGKNKRRQLEAYDKVHQVILSCDSQEECDFIEWLNEAKSLSVINDFTYQPPSFQLSDPIKYNDINGKSRTLFQEHKYSTDFLVTFDGRKQLALAKELKVPFESLSSECSAWIDVKGTFNSQRRSFTTDRKWIWQKFKTYICELIPAKFFKICGVPEACILTKKTKKPRSCYRGFKKMAEALGLK